MDAAQSEVFREILDGPRERLVGVLNTVLHSPKLADLWQKFGAFVRFSTSVPPRLSELAILVTSRRWNSQVEWYVHSEAARMAGLPESVIEAIRRGDPPDFDSTHDAAVYEYARELQGTGQVSPTVYAAVLTQLGAAGIVELTAIIGYYTLVAMTLNAHEIPVPNGAAPPLAGVGRPNGGGLTEFVELTALPPARGVGPATARAVPDNRDAVGDDR
jgi:4-carboxymuconolactone decarboxylase